MADSLKHKDPLPQTHSPSEFAHILTKIAVAQICQSRGFNGSQSSALDALTRITTLYLQSLAKSAAVCAAAYGGRTQCNLFDIIHALEDLHLPAGFSNPLKELRQFVYAIDEVPFARRIPRRERNSGSVVFPAIAISGNAPLKRGSDVPRWLPEFPRIKEGVTRGSKREACWEEEKKGGSTCPHTEAEAGAGTENANSLKFKGGFDCWGVRDYLQGNVSGMENGNCYMLPCIMLQGRREKVKFRVGRRNAGGVGVDGLKLRNGVCRGGKRICLVKRVNAIFDEDEEQPIDTGTGN